MIRRTSKPAEKKKKETHFTTQDSTERNTEHGSSHSLDSWSSNTHAREGQGELRQTLIRRMRKEVAIAHAATLGLLRSHFNGDRPPQWRQRRGQKTHEPIRELKYLRACHIAPSTYEKRGISNTYTTSRCTHPRYRVSNSVFRVKNCLKNVGHIQELFQTTTTALRLRRSSLAVCVLEERTTRTRHTRYLPSFRLHATMQVRARLRILGQTYTYNLEISTCIHT